MVYFNDLYFSNKDTTFTKISQDNILIKQPFTDPTDTIRMREDLKKGL
jgi:hypothetical protein